MNHSGDRGIDKTTILKFVRGWFVQINNHSPVESLLAMLAPDGFVLQFPEVTLSNEEEFRTWYQEVTSKFFDQNHDVKHLEIDLGNDGIEISLLVNWQARTWQAPAAYSSHLDFDAVQSWKVAILPGNFKPVIKRYKVVELIEN
ncbi:MAG: nuclear transport factor 2 family protein [Candidatus Thiodiazotropha sp. (ex Epidulcina cf. delphinae)]|nr:nuclear transport factor 2 family protein [Candidatus Thiodiazotropha sp. (ex Epidulcina cf. delphinae)]